MQEHTALRHLGIEIKKANNILFSFTDPEKVYYLKQGSINLYAVSQEKGIMGHRTLLAHFPESSVLFSWRSKEKETTFEILAASEGDSLLQEISIKDLEEKTLESSLEKWVLSLEDFFQKPIEIAPLSLPEKGSLAIEEGSFFQGCKGASPPQKMHLYWMHLVEGKISLFDQKDLSLEKNSFFPINTHVWFKAQTKASLKVFSTNELIQKRQVHESLSSFHAFFFRYVAWAKVREETQELRRSEEKKVLESLSLQQTFKEMVSILHPQEGVLSPSAHPLYLACVRVGEVMKISFASPSEWPELGTEEAKITAICDASTLRYRQIYLKTLWWKNDSDPFVGFWGEKQIPVALINAKPGIYELFDPSTGKTHRVTAEIAKDLSPVGFVFYRPFPENLRTGKEALKFCFGRHFQEYISLGIYSGIGALLSLFPPILLSVLYGHILPTSQRTLFTQFILLLLGTGVGAALFTLFRSFIMVRIEGKIGYELQAAFWDRLLKLPTQFFQKMSCGDLYYRVNSIEEIRWLLSSKGARAIISGVFGFFYFITMGIYSLKLTLAALVLTTFTILLSLTAAFFKVRYEIKIASIRTHLSGAVTQIISAVSKLRVSGREASAFSYWAHLFTARKKLEMKSQTIQNTVVSTNATLPFLSAALIFTVTIALERLSLITPGEFLAFDASYALFSTALFDVSNTLLDLTPIISMWRTTKVILEEKEEISPEKKHPGKLRGEVSIERVVFQYEENHPILKDVSLHISPGEFVGIAGHSGCGKSTLLRLLLSFEKPLSGAIFFDGKDLSTLNPRDVRKQLGVVLQDTNLTAGSIYENIVCGGFFKPEDVERALELSGFAEDLDTFPMGLHTVITSGGQTLSGGQKQRLLIARALIARPKILIFDEATSALDNRIQDKISHHIDQLDVTRIVVAHRFSTLKRADKIYVLDQGKIVQEGSFEALSKEKGLFQEMLQRQQL